MPTHLFSLTRHFAEVVCSPTDQRLPKQVLHVIQNPVFGNQIVETGAVDMPTVNGVAIHPRCECLFHKPIEIGSVFRDLCFRKDI